MTSRWARVSRGLTAAAFATFIAAFLHVAGGGGEPGIVALALSLSFSGLACIALAGHRLSLWRHAASVLVSQLIFHALFALTPSGGTLSLVGAPHVHGAVHVSVVAGADVPMTGMLPDGPTMWLSHVGAALLTIAALRWGERAFWGLYETAKIRLGRAVRPPFVEPVPPGLVCAVEIDRTPTHLRDLGVLLGRMRHRGPPPFVIAHA